MSIVIMKALAASARRMTLMKFSFGRGLMPATTLPGNLRATSERAFVTAQGSAWMSPIEPIVPASAQPPTTASKYCSSDRSTSFGKFTANPPIGAAMAGNDNFFPSRVVDQSGSLLPQNGRSLSRTRCRPVKLF
jgi:hypothetical protein